MVDASGIVAADRPDGLSGTTHDDDEAIIAQAREAAARLLAGYDWDDWVRVGHAAKLLQTRAMAAAGTTKPQGKRYVNAYGDLLADSGLEEVLGDGSVRSRLIYLIDNLAEVEAWRGLLAANQRLEFNHPNTVWRHFRASRVVPNSGDESQLSPYAKLEEAHIELIEENAKLKDKALAADDAATATLSVLIGLYQRQQLEELWRLLGEHLGFSTTRP
jgi:hypothetical protein